MKNIILTVLTINSLLLISCGNGFEETSKKTDMFTRTSEVEVQLENASNLSYGAGTFGNPARILTDNMGNNVVFSYDEVLDDIYDNGIGGSFSKGKFFRIVENGKNITDDDGLNLTIRAKDLSTIISPPANECYVDPAKGKLVLPRPSYWSRCESANNLINPEIMEQVPYISSMPYESSDGKFANCIYQTSKYSSAPNNGSSTEFRFFGNIKSSPKGTASFWIKFNNDKSWSQSADFYFGDKRVEVNSISGKSALYIFDYNPAIDHYIDEWIITDTSILNQWNHVYIIWDTSKNLGGGNSVRVYFNGTILVSTSNDLTLIEPTNIGMTKIGIGSYNTDSVGNNYIYIDNFKIWNNVLANDNTNNVINTIGNTEELIHPIYGSVNNYKPLLDNSSVPTSGVGYYYNNINFLPY